MKVSSRALAYKTAHSEDCNTELANSFNKVYVDLILPKATKWPLLLTDPWYMLEREREYRTTWMRYVYGSP